MVISNATMTESAKGKIAWLSRIGTTCLGQAIAAI
jgi:hypothetical protein